MRPHHHPILDLVLVLALRVLDLSRCKDDDYPTPAALGVAIILGVRPDLVWPRVPSVPGRLPSPAGAC